MPDLRITPDLPIHSWWYRFCLHRDSMDHWRQTLKDISPFERVMVAPWIGCLNWQDLHQSIFGNWCLRNMQEGTFVYLMQDQIRKVVNVHNGLGYCRGSLVGVMFENEVEAMQFKIMFSEHVTAEEYITSIPA